MIQLKIDIDWIVEVLKNYNELGELIIDIESKVIHLSRDSEINDLDFEELESGNRYQQIPDLSDGSNDMELFIESIEDTTLRFEVKNAFYGGGRGHFKRVKYLVGDTWTEEDTKANGESPRLLTPEQIRAGTNVIMTYAERQAFWKNSEIGKLLGFNRWPDLPQKNETSLIFKLSPEKLVNNNDPTDFIKESNWNQIEAAIRDLDGKSKTLVTLKYNNETYMNIRGSKSGKYVVTATFDPKNFEVLVDLSKFDEIEKLVIDGKEENYPAKIYVDLLHCLLAARTFTQSGKLDPLLAWEKDNSLVGYI